MPDPTRPEASRPSRYRRRLGLPRKPLVLLYHGFAPQRRDDDPENLFVSVADLETQLDHLLEHGWRPLTLDQFLVEGERRRRDKRFLLTIDDGFESVAELALPVMRSKSVPAVLFAPSGMLGGTARWLPEPREQRILGPARLEQLAARDGVEVGAHACEHVDIRGLPPGELDRQTRHARELLARTTGREVRAYAYPYGAHDSAARAALARAGYRVGFSVFEDHGRYAVSRVDVNATDTLTSFRIKLVPAYRVWWRLLGRMAFLRRGIRAVTTRRTRPERAAAELRP